MSKDTAMFVVQRNGVDYKVSGFDIQIDCQDGDLFYVQRGDTVYQWVRREFSYEWEQENYWFHVKNLTEELFVWPRDEEDHNIWDLNTEQRVERMLPGSEYVISGYNDENHTIRFEGNTANWDFGDKTNATLLTEGKRLFANCPNFNGDVSPLQHAKWKTFDEMFLNCHSFNQNISGWDPTHVYNNHEMYDMLRNARVFDQDLSGWCMNKTNDDIVKLEPEQWLSGCPLYNQTNKHPQWTCKKYNREGKE